MAQASKLLVTTNSDGTIVVFDATNAGQEGQYVEFLFVNMLNFELTSFASDLLAMHSYEQAKYAIEKWAENGQCSYVRRVESGIHVRPV